MGYTTFKGSELYAFSPFYPALTYAVHFLTGTYVSASLIVPNVLSFIFPIIVLRLFGLRAALLAETFPAYVVFSMIGYSDIIALVFLALALLLFVLQRYALAGISIGLAGFVFYDLLVVAVVFAAWILYERWFEQREQREVDSHRGYARRLFALLIPVFAAGLAILTFYWISTGDPFRFFQLEHTYWGVVPTTPLGQIQWIFYGSGTGSFTDIIWNIDGVLISSAYWAIRNALFEAFFFFGIYLLVRMKDFYYRWLLVGYSSVLTVPLLFVEGTPVYSIPRLMLVAFPVFLGYSIRVVNKPWRVAFYVAFSLFSACWFLITFIYAFFA